MISGLQTGRIVHVITQSFEHKPAMIIEILEPNLGKCVLRVFGRVYVQDYSLTCSFSDKFEPHTWHWPEREV